MRLVPLCMPCCWDHQCPSTAVTYKWRSPWGRAWPQGKPGSSSSPKHQEGLGVSWEIGRPGTKAVVNLSKLMGARHLCCFAFPYEGVTLRPDVYGDRGLQIYYNTSENKTWERLVTTLQTFLTGKRSGEVSCITLKKRAVTSPLSHPSACISLITSLLPVEAAAWFWDV